MTSIQSRINQVLNETSDMQIGQRNGFGLYNMGNSEVIFSGGMRVGSSPANYTREGFQIFDRQKLEQLLKEKEHKPSDCWMMCKIGQVHLMVRDGTEEPHGLVNIEIDKKFKGQNWGRKVIDCLLAYVRKNNTRLAIMDIKKSAAPFWMKMGIVMTKGDVLANPDAPVFKNITEIRKHRGYIGGYLE